MASSEFGTHQEYFDQTPNILKRSDINNLFFDYDPYAFPNEISSQDIADRIEGGHTAGPLILEIGVARSGTTALLRSFSTAIPALYQPLKSTLRNLGSQDIAYQGRAGFALPSERFLIKEILGPHCLRESFCDPIDVLQRANYDITQMQIVFSARDPMASLVSCLRIEEGVRDPLVMTRNFIASNLALERIRAKVTALGLPTSTYVLEALEDNPASYVVQKLFARLDVPYTDQAVSNWEQLPAITDPASRITILSEPPNSYEFQGIHATLMRSSGLRYIPPNEDDIQRLVKPEYVDLMAQWGVFDLYQQLKQQSEQDLQINIKDRAW